MANIVAFISPNFPDADREKIAEAMHTHEIEITTDQNIATVILEPGLKKTTPKTIPMALDSAPHNLTVAAIAQMVVDQTRGEIFELKQLMEHEEYMKNVVIPEVLPAPPVLPQKSHHNKLRTYSTPKQQFKNAKNIRTRTIRNNIRHK